MKTMTGDIQHIIVIQSLKPGEKQTGQELYNDTISLPLLQMGEMAIIKTHEYADLLAKAAILAKLDEIHVRAPQLQNGLVIHFEMHGSTRLDGLVTASRELLSWPELIDKFRPINIATRNQLYLTLATCNGRYLFEAVDFEQKSPYSGYLSASKDVSVVEIMDSFSDLYSRLLQDGNFIRSYLASETEGGSFFYKDSEETFERRMAIGLDMMRNDPRYRQIVLGGPEVQKAIVNGELNEAQQTELMEQTFREIYHRHKQNFDFSAGDTLMPNHSPT